MPQSAKSDRRVMQGIGQASGDAHLDLSWAVRGGGNFGVVASVSYRLHRVTGAFGELSGYTLDRAADVLQAYREVSAETPGRLALYAGLVTAPAAAC